MAVDGVNNNSNAGLYAAGGALLGAGAGAGAAYLTKPYLKDGAPTDSFIKKINDNIGKEALRELGFTDDEIKEANKFENEMCEKMDKLISNSKTKEELKKGYLEVLYGDINEAEFNKEIEKSMNAFKEKLKAAGVELPKDVEGSLQDLTFEKCKKLVSEDFDKRFEGQTIEQIKLGHQEAKIATQNKIREDCKKLFNEYWDSSKKKFINCEDGVGKQIKKAARSIQNKYAMIYGGIAAAVLGIGAYLFASSKKPAENIDTQA